jgi:hypothetical protein
MDNLTLPQRHDWVAFDYKGKSFRGEVRRVYDKPKGHLMIVKLGEGKYRSCYLEQCGNLTAISTQPEA